MEGGVPFWPALMLSSILGWVVASSSFDLTRRVRALTQPWVTRRVLADTPSILRVQVNPKHVLDFLSLYMLHYVLAHYPQRDGVDTAIWVGLVFLSVMLIGVGETSNSQKLFSVTGIQQTYLHYHHDNVPRIFSPQLPVAVFVGRVLVGIPTILIVKFCSKAIAKWLLPIVCNTLGIPIVSSCYVPTLKGSDSKDKSDGKQSGYLQKLVAVFPHKAYDVDTGIRFLQYAGLAWSVVDLVPSLFSHLNL
ncbi:hypothetical protein GW17_00049018 [Ensete ventricosum]|nr:hypothetical protein GW17_00049018 [Ensete ventricosum]